MLRSLVGAKWRWATLRGERVARYQDERARRIVEFAARHAPFYRAHWAGHNLRDWQTLPTVDKTLMMTHFDQFNTQGVGLATAMSMALAAEQGEGGGEGLTAGLSSGTSGERGLFLVSPAERAAWAGTMLARALHGWPRLPLRVALFLRANSRLYTTLRGRLIDFRYFDLKLPVAEATDQLNQFQPHLLVGPPSLLDQLAEAAAQGSLKIRPQRLIAVAEVMEPQDEARLAAVFNAPVHQIYQCTEGLLAISCAHGRLHVQEDLVAVQFEAVEEPLPHPLPYEGRGVGSRELRLSFTPFPHREGGRGVRSEMRVTPIVTDLWRTTQPIIRYRLGDIIRLDTRPCPCGSDFRVIQAIEGRVDDTLLFETGTGGLRRVFPDAVRRAILGAHAAIRDYEAVQAGVGEIRIYLAVAPGVDFASIMDAVRDNLTKTLVSAGCQVERLTVEAGLSERLPHIKRRRVRRL